MEKEGLIRGIQLLLQKKFKISTLVTDRHKQIAKWMKENLPSTDHRYDIWHLAKCMLNLQSVCMCYCINSLCFIFINSIAQKA